MTSPLARINVRADSWELIWSFAQRVLVVNLCLALGGLPLVVALALVADPWRYPIFFGVLSLPLAPAVAAGFSYLAGADETPLRSLLVSARKVAVPALLVWAFTLAAAGVLTADISVLYDAMPGAALVPLLAVLTALVFAVGLCSLVLLATEPGLAPRARTRMAVYATVRRWPLTLFSLGVLAAAVAIVSMHPLAGLATVPGCALWVVLTNTRLQLAKVLGES
jgi:hypothetical protein